MGLPPEWPYIARHNIQVNRNYQLKAKKYAHIDEDYAFIEEMRDWLYSFTSYIETESEEKDSLRKLKGVIQFELERKKLSKALLDFTLTYVTTRFEHRLDMLCHRRFMNTFEGRVADNCFTESDNSALARDPFGPKPNYKLHKAVGTIVQHTDEQFRGLITDAER